MSAISLEITGDIARITIDNPEKRNALAIEDLVAMGAALDEAAGHEGLRALVLTGAGNRVFSGGVDLSDVSGDGQWEDNPLTALADRLERFPGRPLPELAAGSGAARLNWPWPVISGLAHTVLILRCLQADLAFIMRQVALPVPMPGSVVRSRGGSFCWRKCWMMKPCLPAAILIGW